MGAFPTARYVRGSVELAAGDLLLVYSDGVLESVNKADEEFGLERLEIQLRHATLGPARPQENHEAASAEAMLFSVLAAVQDFAGTHPLVDDLSLVVIRRDA